MTVYDEKHIKTKVREFGSVAKTNFLSDVMTKENVNYACKACITIDSVMTMKNMNYPEVYYEEYKYKIKNIQISKFINTELESESELESKSELV